jgi:hypothetical protein
MIIIGAQPDGNKAAAPAAILQAKSDIRKNGVTIK